MGLTPANYKITRELQELATSLRMVPVRPVFHKMARLAREGRRELVLYRIAVAAAAAGTYMPGEFVVSVLTVGIGGALIGLGGIALAFITMGSQLLFFSPQFVAMILTPLLFLMAGAFALGFAKKG